MPPSLPAAVGLALRALAREPWLLAVGTLVAIVRRAALWPAWAVAAALLLRAGRAAAEDRPFDLRAPIEGVLATAGAPRFLALVAGLWLAGAALAGALRVAYLAGALPTLGGAMAQAPGPRFAAGLAYGFPRVLATAGLALVLEVAGGLFGLTLGIAALQITTRAVGGGSVALAAAVAGALTLAIAVPLALSAVADAAVARSALREEGPGAAFGASGARFLRRPGTFLLGAFVFGLAAALGPGFVEGAGGLLTGFAGEASALVLLGPQLMLALGAAVVAAALDLSWLGTVAALACAE